MTGKHCYLLESGTGGEGRDALIIASHPISDEQIYRTVPNLWDYDIGPDDSFEESREVAMSLSIMGEVIKPRDWKDLWDNTHYSLRWRDKGPITAMQLAVLKKYLEGEDCTVIPIYEV